MKNPFRHFFGKQRKGKRKESEKEYFLCCDFGCDITSPIPSVEPVHENSHSIVSAVVGTVVKLFPGERHEVAEFVSEIMDEEGKPIGIKCRIKTDPKILRFFGIAEDSAWEIDLICEKAVFVEDSKYENGKNTHTYRRLLLTEKKREYSHTADPYAGADCAGQIQGETGEVFEFIKCSGDKAALTALLDDNAEFRQLDRASAEVINEVTGLNLDFTMEGEKVDVCKAIEQIRKEAIEEGDKHGEEKGILNSIRNLMETTSWTAQAAMDALKIPEADRAGYLAKL